MLLAHQLVADSEGAWALFPPDLWQVGCYADGMGAAPDGGHPQLGAHNAHNCA